MMPQLFTEPSASGLWLPAAIRSVSLRIGHARPAQWAIRNRGARRESTPSHVSCVCTAGRDVCVCLIKRWREKKWGFLLILVSAGEIFGRLKSVCLIDFFSYIFVSENFKCLHAYCMISAWSAFWIVKLLQYIIEQLTKHVFCVCELRTTSCREQHKPNHNKPFKCDWLCVASLSHYIALDDVLKAPGVKSSVIGHL